MYLVDSHTCWNAHSRLFDLGCRVIGVRSMIESMNLTFLKDSYRAPSLNVIHFYRDRAALVPGQAADDISCLHDP